jgi:hypothetical protein
MLQNPAIIIKTTKNICFPRLPSFVPFTKSLFVNPPALYSLCIHPSPTPKNTLLWRSKSQTTPGFVISQAGHLPALDTHQPHRHNRCPGKPATPIEGSQFSLHKYAQPKALPSSLGRTHAEIVEQYQTQHTQLGFPRTLWPHQPEECDIRI